MIIKSISVYIIRCLTTNKHLVFKCHEINRFFYQKKNSVKQSLLKDILKTNNYIYELIQKYDNIEGDTLRSYLYDHAVKYEMTSKNNSIETNNQIREKLSYPFRYYSGKRNEEKAGIVIKKAFEKADDIQPTKHRFTHFDFYSSKLNCVFEVKSYSIFSSSLLLGTSKIVCQNIIFILYFDLYPDQFYFLQYNERLFNTFERVQVRPVGRDYDNECFVIPTDLITKIEKDNTYIFDFITVEDINNLIQNDINRHDAFKEL